MNQLLIKKTQKDDQELLDQVFTNPLLLSKILFYCVINNSYNHGIFKSSSSCLSAIQGQLQRQVNKHWNFVTLEIFQREEHPIVQYSINSQGLCKILLSTIPFSINLHRDIYTEESKIVDEILNFGVNYLVHINIETPSQPLRNFPKRINIPKVPECFPAVKKLTITWDQDFNVDHEDWILFVQDIIDRCIAVSEIKVLLTSVASKPTSNWVSRSFRPWTYPADALQHLHVADIFAPSVDEPPLLNLKTLHIVYKTKWKTDLYQGRLTNLLWGCRSSLKELILEDPENGTARFNLSLLPRLEKLEKLTTNQKTTLANLEVGCGLEGNVPALKHIIIEWSLESMFHEDMMYGWIGHSQQHALNSVRCLTWYISRDPVSPEKMLEMIPSCLVRLNMVLPNLRRLQLRLPNWYLRGLVFVFREMHSLHSFSLDIWNRKHDPEVNPQLWEELLIGVPENNLKAFNKYGTYKEYFDKADKEQILGNWRDYPAGIRNMKNLEIISFSSSDNGHSLSKLAVEAGLLSNKRLKRLIVRELFTISSEGATVWNKNKQSL